MYIDMCMYIYICICIYIRIHIYYMNAAVLGRLVEHLRYCAAGGRLPFARRKRRCEQRGARDGPGCVACNLCADTGGGGITEG
jgi:hypothetical protein